MKNTADIRMCSRCILDENIPGISFDEKDVCNFCKEYDILDKKFSRNEATEKKLLRILKEVKNAGKTKEYDCVVGVSGGMDSSYMLYKAVELGLRPLVVHFDNGWNTEKSVSNLKKVIEKLNVDLHTYVVDWEEFRDLQISFLKASVPDIEIPTDIGIKSALYRAASQYGVKYILYGGSNFRTEGKIPIDWTYMDGKYIKDVHKKFGREKLKTFPNLTISDILYFTYIKRIKVIRLLDYFEFEFNKVLELLKKELGWEYYGGKHYESSITKFLQSYILPVKFGIDKRKVHYSALIRSGQLSREEVLNMMKELPYDKKRIYQDKEYICKKLGITEREFDKLMDLPIKSFRDYKTYRSLTQSLPVRAIKRMGLWPKLP
jgi:N-acetyl sugar amidotransferase